MVRLSEMFASLLSPLTSGIIISTTAVLLLMEESRALTSRIPSTTPRSLFPVSLRMPEAILFARPERYIAVPMIESPIISTMVVPAQFGKDVREFIHSQRAAYERAENRDGRHRHFVKEHQPGDDGKDKNGQHRSAHKYLPLFSALIDFYGMADTRPLGIKRQKI